MMALYREDGKSKLAADPSTHDRNAAAGFGGKDPSGEAASVGRCRSASTDPVLQPKQREAEHREENVHIEAQAGVAGSEVMRIYHLIDVPGGSAEVEHGRARNGRQPQIEAPEGGEESDHGKSEACRADLELERAVGPADESG